MSFKDGNLHTEVNRLRDVNGELCAEINRQEKRIRELESLVLFMEPFFMSAVSHGCGCPNGYVEPHGCDDGCKALVELKRRMRELGIEENE